jgi:hypothetical protein
MPYKSYKLNAQTYCDINTDLKQKSKNNWWDAPGLALLKAMLVFLET